MEPIKDSAVAYAVALLSHYGFELRGYKAQELVNLWLRSYPTKWIRLSVIEALYQGRYKAVSVEQILAVWARRGQPIYRFNHEFERLISRKLPQNLTTPLDSESADLNSEYSLPPLTPSAYDTSDETEALLSVSASRLAPEELAEKSSAELPRLTRSAESARVEAMAQDQEPTTKQDTPPLATTALEDLTEIPIQLDDQLPEELSNTGASSPYDADWSRCEVSKPPIHQFTPPPDHSGFYLKLKAVVQQQDSPSANVVTPVIDEADS